MRCDDVQETRSEATTMNDERIDSISASLARIQPARLIALPCQD
jgi:hypothetical protein